MKRVIDFLCGTTVPIWWSLLTSIGAAFASAIFVLYVVPHFNRGFENDKIRTAFILGKLNQLDAQANELALLTNRFMIECSADGSSNVSEIAAASKEERFKLSLLSIEVKPMLRRAEDHLKVDEMNMAVSDLAIPNACPELAQLNAFPDKVAALKLSVLGVSRVLAKSAAL